MELLVRKHCRKRGKREEPLSSIEQFREVA
jgi:hypothetical protein